jgi:hypothetical protein
MIVQDVINRILRDPLFAAELRLNALNAQVGGVGSTEWETLMRSFARNPKELKQLKNLSASPSHPDCTMGTSTTITTVSSAACMITTVTNTTSWFCEGARLESKPKKKR